MACSLFCRVICGKQEDNEQEKTEELFFKDGKRKIDYVLVYKEEDGREEDEEERKKAEDREAFHKQLEKQGINIEIEQKEESQDKKTCFVKIHVPWEVLLTWAERMRMKMPLKEVAKPDVENDYCNFSWYKPLKQKLLSPFSFHNSDIKEKVDSQSYYTAEFKKSLAENFDIKDKETFFRTSQRSRIAHRILNFKDGKDKGFGINQLILNDAYHTAYPLHEGAVHGKLEDSSNLRHLLYWEWARWGRWYKLQPLNAIRYYFGDKIGIYFAWLGFYTRMLIIPTLVGIVCLLYSLLSLPSYPPIREVCDSSYPTYVGNLTMCPVCDEKCTYLKVKTFCLAAQITYMFDNEATLFFAVFMSLWATVFLEFWKRHQYKLAYLWDLVDCYEEKDLVRPEYEQHVAKQSQNIERHQTEIYINSKDRITRTGLSVATVIFWVCLIIVAVFSIIVYRVAIHTVFAASINFSSLGVVGTIASPSLLTTITASLISLLIIMLLNKVYERVALKLTNWEIPRTRVDFEDSFTMKIFFFQFVNFYSYLFYIAFFKSTFEGRPGDYNYLFGKWRYGGCDNGGCMYELSIQLLIIMFGKQIWNNIMELFLPWAMNKYRIYKSMKAEEEGNDYTRWEKDYDLADVSMDLFYEYLEMVIQFGFVTLFVVAFPLAPLLALLNNIIEIRLDATKFICEFRRPLALKTSSIGAWYHILELLGVLAVVTNSFTIAVTSETIPKLVYYYVYSFDEFGGNTYEGYVNNSLSIFNVSDFQSLSIPLSPNPFPGENVTTCRYRDYRSPPSANPPYQQTLQYWHVFAARLAFVIVIEHVVFFCKSLLDYLIPDRPRKLMAQIKQEYYSVQTMLMNAEKDQAVKDIDKEMIRLSALNGSTKTARSTIKEAVANKNINETTYV